MASRASARAVFAQGARILICLIMLSVGSYSVRAATSDAATAPLIGKRVALVIGNGAYGELGTLPNPPRDAADITDKLQELHFEVIPVINGDVATMRDALRNFGREAVGADVALVFYAGHGVAMDGENYLIPIGAQIKIKPDLEYETLQLAEIRRQLDFTDARVKIVILDACRNNPLKAFLRANAAQLGRSLSDGGLAKADIEPASGLLIAYATAANTVALDGKDQRNSPFTTALLDNIATPGIDVRVMFSRVRAAVQASTQGTQTPWTEDGMTGEFQFSPVAPEPEKPLPPVTPPDLTAWSAISGSGDPADFETFIATYPDSQLLSAARDRLKLLRDPGAEFDTWKALAGSTDPAVYEIFLRRYPNGAYAPLVSFTLQSLLWQQLQGSGDTAGMEAFLQRFPKSSFDLLVRATLTELKAKQAAAAAQEALQVQSAPSTKEAQPAPAATPAASLTVASASAPPAQPAPEEQTRLLNLVQPEAAAPAPEPSAADAALARADEIPAYYLQFALSALGYYDGLADGKFGPASRRAAARFQQHLGDDQTGDLQPREIVALMQAAANSGNADSQSLYGLMFVNGQGVVQDYATAAQWFGQAAAANNGYGQMNLGLLYRDGLGVPKDPAKARHLFELAASNGQDAAREALRQMD